MSNFMIALKRKGIKMEQSDMLSELSVKLVMACQERDKFRAQIDAVLKACREVVDAGNAPRTMATNGIGEPIRGVTSPWWDDGYKNGVHACATVVWAAIVGEFDRVRPLPPGAEIEYMGMKGTVVYDSPESGLLVECDGNKEEWQWEFDGVECSVLSIPTQLKLT